MRLIGALAQIAHEIDVPVRVVDHGRRHGHEFAERCGLGRLAGVDAPADTVGQERGEQQGIV
jgi:hypothetical protein